jgi:dienelactone hydrolase
MWRVLLGVLLALVAVVGLWHPARVAVQTLVLLPALFPGAPIDPLSAVTATPEQQHEVATYSAGTVDTELFVPAQGGRHPAVMLLLGAGDLPRSDLAVQFATALARLGILVSVPESSGMLAEHLTFDEVEAIGVSLKALDQRSDVDGTRVGIVGLSASGGLAIVAAAQPDLRDEVRFVNSFGSYDDAISLLVDVASHSLVADGTVAEWTPEQRTVEVVGNALTDAGVSEPDRDELLSGTSRERAMQIVSGFPPEVRQRLEAVSPASVLNEVHAHLYLMHDVDDPFIPFTESRMVVAQAPPGLVTRYTEFSIFEHVIPDRPVPWQTFLPDVWKLFWHVHAVLLELL